MSDVNYFCIRREGMNHRFHNTYKFVFTGVRGPDADGILAGLSAAGQAPAADSVGRFAQLRAWKDSF